MAFMGVSAVLCPQWDKVFRARRSGFSDRSARVLRPASPRLPGRYLASMLAACSSSSACHMPKSCCAVCEAVAHSEMAERLPVPVGQERSYPAVIGDSLALNLSSSCGHRLRKMPSSPAPGTESPGG